MERLARTIIAIGMAALLAGCAGIPIRIPSVLPTPTPLPTYTPVQPSPTLTPQPSYTPIQPTPTGPPTSTFTPIPTLTPAATATSVPSSVLAGTTVQFGNLLFGLPEGLGNGVSSSVTTDVEFPFINPSNGEMPLHTRAVLNGYPAQGTLLAPQVLVFPAAEYASYSDMTAALIGTLKTMQYYDGQPLPAGIPTGVVTAHVHSVPFVNGKGIAYLTQFDDHPAMINNQELIYYFHGLTADGARYVEVILPIQATFLTPDNNMDQGLPAGGIPFDTNHLSDYFTKVADKLNATAPEQFMPPLSDLDALVQSISIR